MKANEYYVQYENKASAILTDASQRTQVINDYNKDLLIMIGEYFELFFKNLTQRSVSSWKYLFNCEIKRK